MLILLLHIPECKSLRMEKWQNHTYKLRGPDQSNLILIEKRQTNLTTKPQPC